MNTDGSFGAAGADAKKRAEKLSVAALASPRSEERSALAEEALSLDPGCADARTVLAREASRTGRTEEALAHADAALVAAEDALDEGAKRLLAGSSRKLWRRKVLRPYLRALGELARALKDTGDLEGAIRTAKDKVLARAGFFPGEAPPDVRSLEDDLALWLVEAGRTEEAFDILDNVAEDEMSAPMRYTLFLALPGAHGARDPELLEGAYGVLSEAVASCAGVALGLVGPGPSLEGEAGNPFAGDLPCDGCARYVRGAHRSWRERPWAMRMLSEVLAAWSLEESGRGETEGRVRLLMVRDPAAEAPDEATFKAGLEGLIRSRAGSLGLGARFLRADVPARAAGRAGAPQMLVVAGDAEDLLELCAELADAEATSGYVVIADAIEDAEELAELGINAHTPERLEGAWAEIVAQIDDEEEG